MDIINTEAIREAVIDLHRTGGGNVFYCGYKSLARHYGIKEGGCTDWTGFAGSGKSEILLDILKNCAEYYGHKYLIHMPDAGTPQEVIGKLIHKLSGKQFDEFHYNAEGLKILNSNRLTEDDVHKYLPIVTESFKILDTKVNGSSKALTPKEFWSLAVSKKKELGLFGAVIDSWNYMKHDTEGFSREDKWLEDTLSFRNDLAESSGMHFHTIIHPSKARRSTDGEVQAPDIHSLKGGSEWGNNGKSIIIVNREYGSNKCEIDVVKAKPQIVGVRGQVELSFDVKTGAYTEAINGSVYDSAPLKGSSVLDAGSDFSDEINEFNF
tara:strand:+ start:3585 stop:4553 length:969 start_codon:yes stop_codon:yes gene_type:complete